MFPYFYDQSASPSGPLCAVQEDLSRIFECGEFTDIAFLVGAEKIRGHKAILAGRCSYFARMFKTDMKESDANEVPVKDIKPDVFRELLKFIYCEAKPKCLTGDEDEEADDDEDYDFLALGILGHLFDHQCLTGDKEFEDDEGKNEVKEAEEDSANATHEEAIDLLIAADRFGVDKLKTMCEVFLRDHLNYNNVIEVLIVADRLHCASLFQAAVNVYRMCSDGLKQDRKQKLDPDLLLKLLNLCCKVKG